MSDRSSMSNNSRLSKDKVDAKSVDTVELLLQLKEDVASLLRQKQDSQDSGLMNPTRGPRPPKRQGSNQLNISEGARQMSRQIPAGLTPAQLPSSAVVVSSTGGNMSELFEGDTVVFSVQTSALPAYIVGDPKLKKLGLESAKRDGSTWGASEAYAFRICPKMNYRAKHDLQLARESNEFSREHVQALRDAQKEEAKENALLLSKVCTGSFEQKALVYGEVVQLQNLKSGMFVSMRRGTAEGNPENRGVTLLEPEVSGPPCYFRIMPRFKVRSKGTVVYEEDEILLESIVFTDCNLAASDSFAYPIAVATENHQVPRLLRSPRCLEVNGALQTGLTASSDDFSSFVVRPFSRIGALNPEVLNTQQKLRLLHPEFNGFLSASCDPDKGQVLDALPGRETSSLLRDKNLPAHLPYLKEMSSPNPSDPQNLSAKAVWRFESLEPMSSGNVMFDSPIRIKHYATGKCLYVNTASLAERVSDTPGTGLEFFDCLLADTAEMDKKMAAGSTFYLSPTTAAEEALPAGSSTVRIEYRMEGGRRLYFTVVDDTKPQFPGAEGKKKNDAAPRSRCGFTERLSGEEVFKVIPVANEEGSLLDDLLGYVPFVRLYALRMQTAVNEDDVPFDMCETVVSMLLELIDKFILGFLGALHGHKKPIEFCADAVNLSSSDLAEMYGGQPFLQAQRIACDIKLFDALFLASLACYNRCFFSVDPSPFESERMAYLPVATTKYIFVCMQRIIAGNPITMDYVSRRKARVWRSPTERKSEWWRNIIVDESDDELGSTVLLSLLIASSKEILHRLVEDGLLQRFIALIEKCGPQRRLIQLFGSICVVEGVPMRHFQEVVCHSLWYEEKDKYNLGVTLHEGRREDVKIALKKHNFPSAYGPVRLPNGALCTEHVRVDLSAQPPQGDYLGKSTTNTYPPVMVVWRSSSENWGDTASSPTGFYWCPKELGLPSAGSYTGLSGQYVGELVPLEHLLWVQEPYRLKEAVTGRRGAGTDEQETQQRRAVTLAAYVVDQIDLFAQMCRGRCSNSIRHIGSHAESPPGALSYDMLMGLASNPWLPNDFRAAVVRLVITLFVDRYPQVANCGSPTLPEQLYLFQDSGQGNKSSLPILDPLMTLTDREAFPEFEISPLSSVNGASDPVLSMKSISKFYLLRTLCNESLLVTGGCVTLRESDASDVVQNLNEFSGALIEGQNAMLEFGFQSRFELLKELCRASIEMLEGRNDLETPGKVFVPRAKRFEELGRYSVARTQLKLGVVHTLTTLDKLRVNFKLGALLSKFKKMLSGKTSASQWSSLSAGLEPAVLFAEFESLFEHSRKQVTFDASQLSFEILAAKPDYNHTLLDMLMYKNDAIFSGALSLLAAKYSQRLSLIKALYLVTVIESPLMPVFDDIHSVRQSVLELQELVGTMNGWAVRSKLSGDFDSGKFSSLMSTVDRLTEFIFAARLDTATEKEPPQQGNHKLRDSKKTPLMSKSRAVELDMIPVDSKGKYKSLTAEKISAALAKALPQTPQEMRANEWFQAMDTKKRGVIDSTQFSKGVRGTLHFSETEVSPAEITKMFNMLKDDDAGIVVEALQALSDLSGSMDDHAGAWRDCEKAGGSARLLWSTDVAEKHKVHRSKPTAFHQLILRKLNIQSVFATALEVNTRTAFLWPEDSTVGEMAESHRRMALALSSILSLLKAFVSGDTLSQNLIGKKHLGALLNVAMTKDPGGIGVTEKHYSCYQVRQPKGGINAKDVAKGGNGINLDSITYSFPSNVQEMAQDALLATIRGNQELCAKVGENEAFLDSVAMAVNEGGLQGGNCDTHPLLDFLFVLCAPNGSGGSSLSSNQDACTRVLTNKARYPLLYESVRTCVDRAIASSSSPLGQFKEDPFRMVRLLKILTLENNREAAQHIARMIPIEKINSALTELVCYSKPSEKDILDRLSPSASRANFESYENPRRDNCSQNVFSFAIEMVDLIAMSETEIRSKPLWKMVTRVLAPAIKALTRTKAGDVMKGEPICFAARDLVDYFESLVTKVAEAGLMKEIQSEQARSGNPCLLAISNDLDCIVESKNDHPLLPFLGPRTLEQVTRVQQLVNHRATDEEDSTFVYKFTRKDNNDALSAPDDITLVDSGKPTIDFEMMNHQFLEKLKTNPFIEMAVQRRRFDLVSQFEKGLPGPTETYTGSVETTFSMLIERCVDYVWDKAKSDKEENVTACATVLRLFVDSLVKMRTRYMDESGAPLAGDQKSKAWTLKFVDACDLPATIQRAYTEKQDTLMELKVGNLAVHIVMLRGAEDNDEVSNAALQLLSELLHQGNPNVHRRLYQFIVDEDRGGLFVASMRNRFDGEQQALTIAKKNGMLDGDHSRWREGLSSVFAASAKTSLILSCLCAHHFRDFQDFVREQPMYSSVSIDFLGIALEILSTVAHSVIAVSNFTAENEIPLVASLLEFLYQSQSGPCGGNQRRIASSEVTVPINAIIGAKCKAEEALTETNPSYYNLQARAIAVVYACLEGSTDDCAHDAFRSSLKMKLIYTAARSLDDRTTTTVCAADAARRPLLESERKTLLVGQECLAKIYSIHFELFPHMLKERTQQLLTGTEVSTNIEDEDGVVRTLVEIVEDADTKNGEKLLEVTGVVEVSWLGRTQRCFFPLSGTMAYLQSSAKAEFIANSLLMTTEKRLSMLFEEADTFFADAERGHEMAMKSPAHRWLAKNFYEFKCLAYSFIVALNINVVLGPKAALSPLTALRGANKLHFEEFVSVTITLILGFLIIAAYGVIFWFSCNSDVPRIVFKTDKHIKKQLGLRRHLFSDLTVFRGWVLSLVCTTMLISVHALNFQDISQRSAPVYWFLIFGVHGPWFLICLRASILVSRNKLERLFVITFDLVPNLWNPIVMQALTVLGITTSSHWFALMLLEVLYLSATLLSVISALAFHQRSLVLVVYLIIASLLVCGSFGLALFPEAFEVSLDGEDQEFHTPLSAWMLLLYNIMSRGDLRKVLSEADPKSSDWVPRLMFNGLSFAWIGVLLFTTITALVVDSLANRRVQLKSREFAEKNVCFVCGLHREAYNEIGVGTTESFEEHCKMHDPWNYLAFVRHLLQTTDGLTGLESFVKEMFTKAQVQHQTKWIPSKTSCVIEAKRRNGSESTAASRSDAAFASMEEKIVGLEKLISKGVMGEIETIKRQIDALKKE